MLFFKKKERETQEETEQIREVDPHQQEVDAQREAHKDLPIPTILPMFLNKLNGDDAADVPEDTIEEARKKELIELLYVTRHVGLYGLVAVAANGIIFVCEAVGGGIGHEALIIQLDGGAEAVVIVQLRGQVDFLPVVERSAPK